MLSRRRVTIPESEVLAVRVSDHVNVNFACHKTNSLQEWASPSRSYQRGYETARAVLPLATGRKGVAYCSQNRTWERTSYCCPPQVGRLTFDTCIIRVFAPRFKRGKVPFRVLLLGIVRTIGRDHGIRHPPAFNSAPPFNAAGRGRCSGRPADRRRCGHPGGLPAGPLPGPPPSPLPATRPGPS